MTVWIGFIQWQRTNGFPIEHEPILQSLHNFELKDSILDRTDPDNPAEPAWPEAEFIVGNPPFLGDKKMRGELGDPYVEKLRSLYAGRIPGQSDLCCYWFEKARAQIERKICRRAGLLATQGIRGGANRVVLENIKQTGDIFFAASDRNWVLHGANVHISLVAFDDGLEAQRVLDGRSVSVINANLTSLSDTSKARRLTGNAGVAFLGTTKKATLDIPFREALKFLQSPNPNGRPNSDVLLPYANGISVTRRPTDQWIIDFAEMSKEEASLYEAPFKVVLYFPRFSPVLSNQAEQPLGDGLNFLLGDPGA
jgi:type II restriction/modification system DNA methylase subunit YeeA